MQKRVIFIIVLFAAITIQAQENRLVRQNDLRDSLITIRAEMALITTGGVDIQFPDANTIQIATGEAINLDPTTLEINGSNQLTVIGGTSGSGGLFETDGNGDLMPNDAEVTDTYYELDGNGDIQPI